MSRFDKDLSVLAQQIVVLEARGVLEKEAAEAIARAWRDVRHALRVKDWKRADKAIARLSRALVEGLCARERSG